MPLSDMATEAFAQDRAAMADLLKDMVRGMGAKAKAGAAAAGDPKGKGKRKGKPLPGSSAKRSE